MNNPRVFHHRPPHRVGSEVLALDGQPGFGGWMPFLHGDHIMKEEVEGDGNWLLRMDTIDSRIRFLADDIRRAGFVMLDTEGPLADHTNLVNYQMASSRAKNTLRDLRIRSQVGFYRIPDQSRKNTINRFAFIPVLRDTDAVFIPVKGIDEKWTTYLKDVAQVSPHHEHVVYMDAYSRKDGSEFSQEFILAVMRLAHNRFPDTKFVFRQSGPHVAQVIRWALDWLGFEEQTT